MQKWCAWVDDELFGCTMYPEEVYAETSKEAAQIMTQKGLYVIDVVPWEQAEKEF